MTDNYSEIIDNQVEKLQNIFDNHPELTGELLHIEMLKLIENTPYKIHNHLFIKFTFMLGEKLKIDHKTIIEEINKN